LVLPPLLPRTLHRYETKMLVPAAHGLLIELDGYRPIFIRRASLSANAEALIDGYLPKVLGKRSLPPLSDVSGTMLIRRTGGRWQVDADDQWIRTDIQEEIESALSRYRRLKCGCRLLRQHWPMRSLQKLLLVGLIVIESIEGAATYLGRVNANVRESTHKKNENRSQKDR
jgi:hypothetical protein